MKENEPSKESHLDDWYNVFSHPCDCTSDVTNCYLGEFSKEASTNGIESVKKNAPIAKIVEAKQ